MTLCRQRADQALGAFARHDEIQDRPSIPGASSVRCREAKTHPHVGSDRGQKARLVCKKLGIFDHHHFPLSAPGELLMSSFVGGSITFVCIVCALLPRRGNRSKVGNLSGLLRRGDFHRFRVLGIRLWVPAWNACELAQQVHLEALDAPCFLAPDVFGARVAPSQAQGRLLNAGLNGLVELARGCGPADEPCGFDARGLPKRRDIRPLPHAGYSSATTCHQGVGLLFREVRKFHSVALRQCVSKKTGRNHDDDLHQRLSVRFRDRLHRVSSRPAISTATNTTRPNVRAAISSIADALPASGRPDDSQGATCLRRNRPVRARTRASLVA